MLTSILCLIVEILERKHWMELHGIFFSYLIRQTWMELVWPILPLVIIISAGWEQRYMPFISIIFLQHVCKRLFFPSCLPYYFYFIDIWSWSQVMLSLHQLVVDSFVTYNVPDLLSRRDLHKFDSFRYYDNNIIRLLNNLVRGIMCNFNRALKELRQ